MWQWQTSVVMVQEPARGVLLVRQSYGHRFYGLPGGKVEPGETAEAAAMRELREETGLDADAVAFLRTYNLVYPGTNRRYGAHAFRCEKYSGTLATQVSDEIAAVGWWPLNRLPEPLTPSAEVVLREFATHD